MTAPDKACGRATLTAVRECFFDDVFGLALQAPVVTVGRQQARRRQQRAQPRTGVRWHAAPTMRTKPRTAAVVPARNTLIGSCRSPRARSSTTIAPRHEILHQIVCGDAEHVRRWPSTGVDVLGPPACDRYRLGMRKIGALLWTRPRLLWTPPFSLRTQPQLYLYVLAAKCEAQTFKRDGYI